jgi:inner membrane protein
MAQWERLPMFGAEPTALAREAWQHPDFAFFRWFAMYPLLHQVEAPSTPVPTNDTAARADVCVWYRDLRFTYPGRNTTPFRYGMCRHGADDTWAPYALGEAGRMALR